MRFVRLQRRKAIQRFRRRFVTGLWLTTSDYFARARNTADRGEGYEIVLPAGRTEIAAPTFAFEPPASCPAHVLSVRYSERMVATFSGAWVLGSGGAILASDRRLIWNLSYEWPGQPYWHTAYHLPQPPRALELPGTTAVLAAAGADRNYFHLLLNSVARLAYLQRARTLPPIDRYLVSGTVTSFVAETFRLFGIAREQLVGANESPAFRPERLIVPSLVEHPFIVPAHACEFLRETILTHLPTTPGPRRRFFIDRSDAPTRRIANLAELKPLLDDFGIEIVRLQGRSVLEQAALFQQAELIIANHGAALTNLVFCQPDTRVLQILAPGMAEREYRTISQHGRLRHDYLVAEFHTSSDRHLALKDRDLQIPARLLEHLSPLRNGLRC